jgi:hypothetical protein
LLDGQLSLNGKPITGDFNYAQGRQAMNDFLEHRNFAQHPQLLPALAEDPLDVGSSAFLGARLPAPSGSPLAAQDAAPPAAAPRDTTVHVRFETVSPALRTRIAALGGVTIVDKDGDLTLSQSGTQVQGSQPDSFYLLFPNQLDSANAISANQELALPRSDWSVTALGPRGTDHLLVMVTETARDFSALALPVEYVSQSGPFEKIQRTPQAVARIGQIATLSAATSKPACQNISSRDLGVARQCSNVFGASLVSVEEID